MKKGILLSAIAFFLLGTLSRAETVRARIHINTHLVVHHNGSSDYAAWGSPADYETQVLEVLHDMLQAKGISRVDIDEDFIITVDKMELLESTRKRTVKDPKRPGVQAHTYVANIRVRLAGSILNKHTGERKKWRRAVEKSEDVQFQQRNGQSRPPLEKRQISTEHLCATEPQNRSKGCAPHCAQNSAHEIEVHFPSFAA